MSSQTSTLDSARPYSRGLNIASGLQSGTRLLCYAYKANPFRFNCTITVSLIGALLEGSEFLLVIPFLAVAGIPFPGNSGLGKVAGLAREILLRLNVPVHLWLAALLSLFLVSACLRSFFRRAQSILTFVTASNVALSTRKRLYATIVRAKWTFLVQRRMTELSHILNREVYQLDESVTLLLSIISSALLAVLYLATAVAVSVPMTVIVLCMGGILSLLLRRTAKQMLLTGGALSNATAKVHSTIEEHFLNLKTIKMFHAEDQDIASFEHLCAEATACAVTNARFETRSALWFEIGSAAALTVAIFVSLTIFHVGSAMILLLLAVFSRLVPQVTSIVSRLHHYAANLPSFEKIVGLQAECDGASEFRSSLERGQLRLGHELALDSVSYKYERGPASSLTQTALRDVTLRIVAGKITGLTGPSGSGKSTIADLAGGLIRPTSGTVRLGETVLDAELGRNWRRQIGYLGQDATLFHETIRENLLWASRDADANELERALALASAEFVHDLPEGLDTSVGDHGILLSSGQRQRVCLARALLRRPSLLIMDEATSFLDEENEHRILTSLSRLRGDLTILLISHKKSVYSVADYVYVLDEGKIVSVEIGSTMEELAKLDL